MVSFQPGKRFVQFLFSVVMILSLTTGFVAPAPVAADFGAWSSKGPNGSIQAIAIDRKNEQLLYAGGDGGLWKSTDGGTSWTAVNALTPLGRGIAIDPFNTDTLYAISGDSRTILKSTNGGSDWNTVSTAAANDQYTDLVVDPNRADRIYVALGGASKAQIARSLDGGKTWTMIADPNLGQGGIGGSQATSVAMLPGVPNLLYAGVQVYHGGSLIRTDEAVSAITPVWTTVATDSQVQSLSAPFKVVVAGNALNRSIYSAWLQSGSGELARNDNDGPPVKLGDKLPYRKDNAPSFVSAMTVNPIQTTWLYAAVQNNTSGEHGVFASTDGGQTWNELGSLTKDVFDLKLAVRTHTLYAATADGVYQFTITWPVASRFGYYYNKYDGLRLLGHGISIETVASGYPSQYFEKGRIEDHKGESEDPNWRFMYGLLVDELQQAKVNLPIGGDVSTLTYADLNALAAESQREAPPADYDGSGVYTRDDGTTFVPFSGDLSGAPGHNVLGGFWHYINRTDLFPGGWLHDVGLPITAPKQIIVTKNLPSGPVQREITVQAFQRTILTYDPANPPEWQIERANVGTDYRLAFPERVGP